MFSKIKILTEHQGFQKYFKNTSWLLGEKVLRMFVGLFVGVWVARYLGPERYGLFSYVQSFVGLFTVLSTLGLDSIVVRELVKDDSHKEALLSTTFVLKLCAAFLTVLLLGVAVCFTSNDAFVNKMVFIVASAVFFQSFNVIDMFFQAKVLSRYVVYANTVSLCISSLLKVVCIFYQAPLIAFVWIVLFDSMVLALGLIYFYARFTRWNIHFKVFDATVAKALLQNAWPLMLSGLVVSIYMKIDQVMIQEMLGSEAVGHYAAAVRISEAWYFIPMVIASSLFPAIVNAKQVSEELYYTRLQRLYTLMIWLAILIALPMTFLSHWVVHLLYGSQYVQAGDVLRIHIWAGVFVFLGVASSFWLVNENLQIFSTLNTLIGAFSNIGLNYFLIDSIGIQGAAWATLISYALAAYISLSFWDRTRINFICLSKSIIFKRVFDDKKMV